MDTETMSNGSSFVPSNILRALGGFRPWVAEIKTEPSFFRVEEQHTDSHLCTVGTGTDLPDHEWNDEGEGDLVAVTLVKCWLNTPLAIKKLANLLGVPDDAISYAGLKDRKAETSQRVKISGVTLEHVRRNCMPEALNGRQGFFIKDATRSSEHLQKGHLKGNRFTIRVLVPGKSKEAIDQYVKERVGYLSERGMVIPNAYGRQRLGRRQNLLGIAHTFITKGAEAAIFQFLTETSPNESAFATQIRQKLAAEWAIAVRKAGESGTTVASQVLSFQAMKEVLEQKVNGPGGQCQAWEKLNMPIEHTIVLKTLQMRDFNKVMFMMRDDFSLWIGAYQSYWFNQILSKYIAGDIRMNDRSGNPSIPLYLNDRDAKRFYQTFAPEALPEQIDPAVDCIFLTLDDRKYDDAFWRKTFGRERPHARKRRGPWRKLFVHVKDFSHSTEDGVLNCSFTLRSGSYATTFLGVLFDLEGDDVTGTEV